MIPVLVVVGVGVLILETIVVAFALSNGGRARLVRETPLTSANQLVAGPATLVGQAVAMTGALDGPLSGKPCVYYRFRVQEKRSHATPHGGSSHWKTVIDDTQSAPCALDDGTGVAAVALGDAEFVLTESLEASSGFWSGASPEVERMLGERYGRSAKGLIFNKSMRYFETLIQVSQSLVVVGTAQPTAGGHWIIARETGPLIVSDIGDARLATHYRRLANMFWLLAVVVLVVAGVGTALALGAL